MIYKYKNGNVDVSIDTNNGTKVRTWEGDFSKQELEFPESLDVKITNYCDLNCPYCHENSSKEGKHADLDKLFEKISVLPKGIELALGGGNPLSHPKLPGFLKTCKKEGYICSITVNQDHLNSNQYFYMLRSMSVEGLVKGIGISYNPKLRLNNLIALQKYSPNVVMHAICGVHKVEDLKKLESLSYLKLLVLGYKEFGRGVEYKKSHDVDANTEDWYRELSKLVSEGKIHPISFDNLALSQLDVKRLVTDELYSKLYQGDDFTISMYIDAVEGKYAPTSRSSESERLDWDNLDLLTYFKK
jgi:MoaA/NifB/PqqE/SkfB family radical SAM enzyme